MRCIGLRFCRFLLRVLSRNSIIALIFSMVFGCLNDVLSKKISTSLSSEEIVFFRFFIGTLVLLPIVQIEECTRIDKISHLLNFIRSLLGLCSIWLCTYAIIHLKLIEVTMLLWTIPLFEILINALFF